MSGSTFVTSAVNFFSLSKGIIIAAVIIIAVILFIGAPLPISGASMEPNFRSGQAVIIEHLSYLGANSIQRGDVVAARFPADPDRTKLIKRVVGLPGELVYGSEGKIFVNGSQLDETNYTPISGVAPYTESTAVLLGENEYFLVGDNRPGSSDSRLWGPVQKRDIVGRVAFVLWPIGDISYVNRPSH